MASEWSLEHRQTGIRRCHTCWNLTQVCHCMRDAVDDALFGPAAAQTRPDTALSADFYLEALLEGRQVDYLTFEDVDNAVNEGRKTLFGPNPPLFRHFLTFEELERAIDEAAGYGYWPKLTDEDD